MKTLKNKNGFILILCLLCQIVTGQSTIPQINKDNILKDIVEHNNGFIPEHYVINYGQDRLNINYIDDFCIVHIGYKNTSMHSSEKFSLVIIYKFINNTWLFQNVIPYYYELELLKSNQMLFFSNNLFCDLNHACNRLMEISKFDGQDFIPLVQYEGYDMTIYYEVLLLHGEEEEIQKAVGDTICNNYMISDIQIYENGLKSYMLTHEVKVLKGIDSDTLQFDIQRHIEKIYYTFD